MRLPPSGPSTRTEPGSPAGARRCGSGSPRGASSGGPDYFGEETTLKQLEAHLLNKKVADLGGGGPGTRCRRATSRCCRRRRVYLRSTALKTASGQTSAWKWTLPPRRCRWTSWRSCRGAAPRRGAAAGLCARGDLRCAAPRMKASRMPSAKRWRCRRRGSRVPLVSLTRRQSRPRLLRSRRKTRLPRAHRARPLLVQYFWLDFAYKTSERERVYDKGSCDDKGCSLLSVLSCVSQRSRFGSICTLIKVRICAYIQFVRRVHYTVNAKQRENKLYFSIDTHTHTHIRSHGGDGGGFRF